MNKEKNKNLLTGKNFAIGLIVGIIAIMFFFWSQVNFSSDFFANPVKILAYMGMAIGFSLVLVPMILGMWGLVQTAHVSKKKYIEIGIIIVLFLIGDLVMDRLMGIEINAGIIVSELIAAGASSFIFFVK